MSALRLVRSLNVRAGLSRLILIALAIAAAPLNASASADLAHRTAVARSALGNLSSEKPVARIHSERFARRGRCSGLVVPKGANLAETIEHHPGGTTFCITSGVHRVAGTLTIKPRDRLIGASGAIVNGSRLLTNWTASGTYWKISGQTQEHIGDGWCEGAHPRCDYRDDVFFDDKPLQAVADLSSLGPGRFFFDYPNDTIYIADNPARHKVEGAVAPGIDGCSSSACGPRTLISGLIFEKFAGNAIQISDGTVENNEVRWNHMTGISVARDGTIRNNYVHDNGLQGFSAVGPQPKRNLLIERNESAHNGWYAGYNMGWEGGGGKWLGINGMTIRKNYIHNNHGSGLWADTDNIHIIYENNRIENNTGVGIEHEASYDAIIRNNTIRRNGFGPGCGGWVLGAGILIAQSANVEIYGNDVEDNCDGIGATQRSLQMGAYGVQEVKNLYVHDNTVRTAGIDGLTPDLTGGSSYTSNNNRWVHNTYILSCKQPRPFAWNNMYIPAAQWQAYGNDTTGRFVRRTDCH